MLYSYSLKKSDKENLALKSGVFSFAEDEMYAGTKPLRNPQPSKEAVRELILTDVREHRPPRTQDQWRIFWRSDECARKAVMS